MSEADNFKNRYLQQPITFLTEENLDKLENHCKKAIHYERGVEHQVVLELLERYKEFLAEREEDKKKIAELKEYIFIAPNLDEMTAAKYISIRRDAYIRGRADEQQKAEEIINNNYVSKQKVKEELEEAEKENEPYEQHNKESRIYWINKGKISLAKKIIGG